MYLGNIYISRTRSCILPESMLMHAACCERYCTGMIFIQVRMCAGTLSLCAGGIQPGGHGALLTMKAQLGAITARGRGLSLSILLRMSCHSGACLNTAEAVLQRDHECKFAQ